MMVVTLMVELDFFFGTWVLRIYRRLFSVSVYIHLYVFIRVCVCVCVFGWDDEDILKATKQEEWGLSSLCSPKFPDAQ